MLVDMIDASNAVIAAQHLLALDDQAIDKSYYPKMDYWTRPLQDILEHYHQEKRHHASVLIQQQRTEALVRSIKNILSILTEEAKNQLMIDLMDRHPTVT